MKSLSHNAYVLKLLAVAAMIMNHISIGWADILPFWLLVPLFAIGGLTYTVMAFFVVEGYRHTSNLGKYIGRLLLFGTIAQAFHPMVLGVTAMLPGPFLNIMFSISLALVVLYLYDTIKNRFVFWLLFIVACFVSLFMDLPIISVLVPLLYHSIKKESKRRTTPGVVMGAYYLIFGAFAALPVILLRAVGLEHEVQNLVYMTGIPVYIMLATPTFAIGSFIGAILIRNFNGERGKRSKWLFYVAYPMHLAIIALIGVALGVISFNLYGVFFVGL